MGSLLALGAGMRTLGLLITLLAAAPQAATDQRVAVPDGTVISSAQVTGFDSDRLESRPSTGHPEPRRHPAETGAARRAGGTHRGREASLRRRGAHGHGSRRPGACVFRRRPPGRARPRRERQRALCRRARRHHGRARRRADAGASDDLQALVGKRLDSGDADRLQERLEHDLPDYEVSRRIERGSEVGRIRLVFEARKKAPPNWLRFEPLRSNLLYHSDHGWGGFWDFNIGEPDDPVHTHGRPRLLDDLAKDTPATGCGSRRGSSYPAAWRQLRVVLVGGRLA